jgi:hypothetical protein
MTDAAPPEPDDKPALAGLLVELTNDMSRFARAEVAYIKAQAGERAHFAVPGLAMFGVGLAIATGILMAVPAGLIMLLSPMIGTGWSILAVTTGGLIITALLIKLGVRRIKAVLKRPEDR